MSSLELPLTAWWRSLRGTSSASAAKQIRWPLAIPLLVLLLLASQLLIAILPSVQVTQAHVTKAKLDAELTRAQTQLAIPDSLLAPIATAEQQVAAGKLGVPYD